MQPDMRQATANATATRVMRSSERVTRCEKSPKLHARPIRRKTRRGLARTLTSKTSSNRTLNFFLAIGEHSLMQLFPDMRTGRPLPGDLPEEGNACPQRFSRTVLLAHGGSTLPSPDRVSPFQGAVELRHHSRPTLPKTSALPAAGRGMAQAQRQDRRRTAMQLISGQMHYGSSYQQTRNPIKFNGHLFPSTARFGGSSHVMNKTSIFIS
jgi:hypothetical protein